MSQEEEYYNYEQYIKFTIGHAGTGKSTKLATEADISTLVLTPTHKAKEVLMAKGVENVVTIHSVLKLVPTIDENFRKRGSLQKLKRAGDIDLKNINKVIIDEFSMIPTHIMDLLLDVLPSKAVVSVYGDPYQLPPVDGDPIEPDFYAREIDTLTVQYRAEAPEVVETFTRFVNYLESGDSRIDLRLNPKIKKGSLDFFNPDTDRALAYTNETVIDINNNIARKLNMPSNISIGEQVVINSLLATVIDYNSLSDEERTNLITIYPQCVSKGRLMEGESLKDKISEIEYNLEKFKSPMPDGKPFVVEINEQPYAIMGDIQHYKHSKAYKRGVEDSQLALINNYGLGDDVDLKAYCRQHKCEFTRARGKAWSTFLGHQGLVWDIRRPFCTTIHKAQGSEFDTVYIAQDDIKKAIRGRHYEQYARLMYVALSRATKRVVII